MKVSISYKPFSYPGAHRWPVGWRMLETHLLPALCSQFIPLATSPDRDGRAGACPPHHGILFVLFSVHSQQPAQDLRNICVEFWAAGPQNQCSKDICKSTQYFPIVFLASLLLGGTPLKHQPQDRWPP